MAQPIAADYGQQFLFPPALEDWVGGDHPVRFLREFVDQLDLGQLGFEVPTAREGRPPYHPNLLLKIWLYGYFFKLRSTRKLETACGEVVPLMWLAGLQAPDHNSLWRFWRDNRKAIKGVFKQTVHLAMQTGAVGLVLQAVDGTKIQACAARSSGWTKEHMEAVLKALDETAEQTELKVMEENAVAKEAAVRLPAGLAQRQALREQIEEGLRRLEADQRKHYHPVEPEARRMHLTEGNRYAYNAQAVVDAKEGVIVACEATRNESDAGLLSGLIGQAQANLGSAAVAAAPLTLADAGYGAGADLQKAAEEQHPVLIPPAVGSASKNNPYACTQFKYDSAQDTVTCPEDQTLDYEGSSTKDGVPYKRFRCHHRECPVRHLCSKDPKGRQIQVWSHTPLVQAMRERLQNPHEAQLYAKRMVIVEPRFAQLKEHDGFRRWTVWGLESVQAQWAMLCATLNLRVLYRRWRMSHRPAGSTAAALRAVRLGRPAWARWAQMSRFLTALANFRWFWFAPI